MGVATAVAAGGALLSVGTSVAGMIGENKKAKAAQDALNNYKRQELVNPFENLQVSTKGTDLALEQNATNTQSMVEVLQKGGINGLAMLPQIQAKTNALNLNVAANLDQQYINNENRKAEGVMLVQNMQEQRENQDLAGIGQALATAQQNQQQFMQSAVNGVITGATSVASTYGNEKFKNTYPNLFKPY